MNERDGLVLNHALGAIADGVILTKVFKSE